MEVKYLAIELDPLIQFAVFEANRDVIKGSQADPSHRRKIIYRLVLRQEWPFVGIAFNERMHRVSVDRNGCFPHMPVLVFEIGRLHNWLRAASDRLFENKLRIFYSEGDVFDSIPMAPDVF